MFRYKLRTLLIVLALGPPVVGRAIVPAVRHCLRDDRCEAEKRLDEILRDVKLPLPEDQY